ncbi:hypothetical protein ACJX0J_007936 [Zea mays]
MSDKSRCITTLLKMTYFRHFRLSSTTVAATWKRGRKGLKIEDWGVSDSKKMRKTCSIKDPWAGGEENTIAASRDKYIMHECVCAAGFLEIYSCAHSFSEFEWIDYFGGFNYVGPKPYNDHLGLISLNLIYMLMSAGTRIDLTFTRKATLGSFILITDNYGIGRGSSLLRLYFCHFFLSLLVFCIYRGFTTLYKTDSYSIHRLDIKGVADLGLPWSN